MKKCPICNGHPFLLKRGLMFSPPEHSVIWNKISRGYNILKCSKCSLEFCDPMPTEKVLRILYSKTYKNPRASEEIVKLNSQKNINYLAKYGLAAKSKLLDFGSGEEDYFIKTGKNDNWHSYDPYLNNSHIIKKDYDFVTLWGVLEHLTNPVKTMGFVNSVLKKGGQVIITTIFNPFTNIHYNYKPPEHTLYFTEDSIKKLFVKTGFKIIEYSPYQMYQKPEIYLWCILNASQVVDKVRNKIHIDIKDPILVPTNEVLIIGKKI